jgi:spermidine synthase
VLGRNRKATLAGFALITLFEALLIVIPYAMGDRLAVLSILLRSLEAVGFGGQIFGWTIVTAIVVLPAAFVAGIQFPYLIALLGQGQEHVGRQVGQAYAWNTAGAILGSLVGGFGILPLLSAEGAWILSVVCLVVLGTAAIGFALREAHPRVILFPVGVAAVVLALVTAVGPTEVWRNSHRGDVRIDDLDRSPNGLRAFAQDKQRHIIWQEDGVESGVAISAADGYAFVINGRTDGNARHDAQTQVMLGVVGAILHPAPRSSFVIGLGTGCTAGWLGAVPGMERVDVAELEPSILTVARFCTPVNNGCLDRDNVNVILGDAREILITTPDRYDLIVSEPSNPYRVGIASLFTTEFYRSVEERLNDGGIFLQWLQAYQVTGDTVQTVYATLKSVFPAVNTFQTSRGDLLLVCTRDDTPIDMAQLRSRVADPVLNDALLKSWYVNDAEGFLSRFVASDAVADAIAALEDVRINTDDRTLVEFGFARSVGRSGLFEVPQLREQARTMNAHRPIVTGDIDWERVDDARMGIQLSAGLLPDREPGWSEAQMARATAQVNYVQGKVGSVAGAWSAQSTAPSRRLEFLVLADALADAGDASVPDLVRTIATWSPLEASIVAARHQWRTAPGSEAVERLARALEAYREDPWPWPILMRRALSLAVEMAEADPRAAQRVAEALSESFSVAVLEETRKRMLLEVATHLDPDRRVAVLEQFEPHVPWQEGFLRIRAEWYDDADHPNQTRAEEDLRIYRENALAPFSTAPTDR